MLCIYRCVEALLFVVSGNISMIHANVFVKVIYEFSILNALFTHVMRCLTTLSVGRWEKCKKAYIINHCTSVVDCFYIKEIMYVDEGWL